MKKSCENCRFHVDEQGVIRCVVAAIPQNSGVKACNDWKPKPAQRKVQTIEGAPKASHSSLLKDGSGSAAEKQKGDNRPRRMVIEIVDGLVLTTMNADTKFTKQEHQDILQCLKDQFESDDE